MRMRMIFSANPCRVFLTLVCMLLMSAAGFSQAKKTPSIPGPMLSAGTVDFDTPDFTLTLVKSSQTVAGLKAKRAASFDFTPGDILVERSQNGYYHLGDIDLRVRVGVSGEWKSYSTAVARKPVSE